MIGKLRKRSLLRVVGIQDEEPGSALLVKKIYAQGDLTSQVIKQVAHVQRFVDTYVAAVVKLAGVQVPTLDKPLGQHQCRAGEFCVWKQQVFALDHRIASIAHLRSARQATRRFALNSKYGYNV
jgi:hypothetical protein